MKKKIYLLALLLSIIIEAKSQFKERGLGIQMGCSYQRITQINLGINYLFVKNQLYESTIIPKIKDSLTPSIYTISKKSISSSGFNFSLFEFKKKSNLMLGQSIGYLYSKSYNSGMGYNFWWGYYFTFRRSTCIKPHYRI